MAREELKWQNIDADTLAYGDHEDRTPTHGYEDTAPLCRHSLAVGQQRASMRLALGRASHRQRPSSESPRLRSPRGGGASLRGRNLAATFAQRRGFPFGPMSRPRKTRMEKMSEWVLHCAVNQRHIRRSQPTREAALKDACSQLLQGHAVNRIVGPNETITAERVRDWCAKHRPSPITQDPPRSW